MILDRNVIFTRSNFQSNRECDFPLNIFVNCDWIFENNAQHPQGVSLNLEYELNILHKT